MVSILVLTVYSLFKELSGMIKIRNLLNSKFLIGAFLFILFLLALLFVGQIINNNRFNNLSKNEEKAQVIIDAIYRYKQTNGTFPQSLDNLRPDFLKEIPTTVTGDSFSYSTEDGFRIEFSVTLHHGCSYTDKYKSWECTSGD
jgi:hypothetical protein